MSEAGVRGGLPRWKVTDPIELPELVVRTDIKPGKDPLDYRNPEVSDLRTFGRGDVVIVGKKDSAEDPRRLAEVQADGRLADKDADGSPPENPSGEDLLVPRDEGKSRRERLLNETANQKFIEGLDDTGKNFGNKTLDFLKDRPQVTGAHAVVPCQPIARETPPSVNQPGGGVDAILGATCAALAVVKMTVESRRSKSKAPAQAEGDRTDGDY